MSEGAIRNMGSDGLTPGNAIRGPVDRYSKVELWVRKDNFLPQQSKFFDTKEHALDPDGGTAGLRDLTAAGTGTAHTLTKSTKTESALADPNQDGDTKDAAKTSDGEVKYDVAGVTLLGARPLRMTAITASCDIVSGSTFRFSYGSCCPPPCARATPGSAVRAMAMYRTHVGAPRVSTKMVIAASRNVVVDIPPASTSTLSLWMSWASIRRCSVTSSMTT